MPTDKLKYAAVLGHPVSHSLSPRLHNYWLKEYNIGGEYTAIDTPPADLKTRLKELADKGFAGVNLTLPLKEDAPQLMDEVDDFAKRIGAVNTIVFRDGKMFGRNTDAYGFTQNLQAQGIKLSRAVALVIGAGGASRAVCAGLQDAGARIILVNRSHEKAEALAESLGGIEVRDWNDITKTMVETSLLVNTTSLGMKGSDPLALSLATLPPSAVVTDIVYSPLKTALLKSAEAHGNITVDGLGMLLYQAQPAFESWFGVKPEVTDALRAHVLAGLA